MSFKIQISKDEIRKKSKKMNAEELQEHLKAVKQGSGIKKSKKVYSRKNQKRDY